AADRLAEDVGEVRAAEEEHQTDQQPTDPFGGDARSPPARLAIQPPPVRPVNSAEGLTPYAPFVDAAVRRSAPRGEGGGHDQLRVADVALSK
ncbi:hypothetical protein AB0B10_30625, partial [Micromonospora arborensis]|uniref:hypothetical protein n=1 Tax=Micromonospora arborensis TaxID=2116518 RepID=UPI0033D5EE4D